MVAEASLGHAALKGITLKITQGLYSFGVFTMAAGMGATIGAAMAVADGVGAYGVYIGNEYLWDTFRPNTKSALEQRSVWRLEQSVAHDAKIHHLQAGGNGLALGDYLHRDRIHADDRGGRIDVVVHAAAHVPMSIIPHGISMIGVLRRALPLRLPAGRPAPRVRS